MGLLPPLTVCYDSAGMSNPGAGRRRCRRDMQGVTCKKVLNVFSASLTRSHSFPEALASIPGVVSGSRGLASVAHF